MMPLLKSISSLLMDPPPAWAFEVSERGVAAARLRPAVELSFHPLPAGTLAISPVKDNVLQAGDLANTVRAAAPPQQDRGNREMALILPDNSVRVSVLEFEEFPAAAKEQESLVRFRLRKSVPFDLDTCSLSFTPQFEPGSRTKAEVIAAASPLEVVARYEAPFRAAGMIPGLVSTSALACMDLLPANQLSVLAKLSGGVLTVLVADTRLRLVRTIEISHADLAEIAADLYPTLVYVEDQFGAPASTLFLCGFGEMTANAASRFSSEFGMHVAPLESPFGRPLETNAGLLGYLVSGGSRQ